MYDSLNLTNWLLTTPSMAYAEIFLALTHIMRNFEFQLHDTSVDDVRLFRDRFFGAAQDGSVGVRVLVNEVKY